MKKKRYRTKNDWQTIEKHTEVFETKYESFLGFKAWATKDNVIVFCEPEEIPESKLSDIVKFGDELICSDGRYYKYAGEKGELWKHLVHCVDDKKTSEVKLDDFNENFKLKESKKETYSKANIIVDLNRLSGFCCDKNTNVEIRQGINDILKNIKKSL